MLTVCLVLLCWCDLQVLSMCVATLLQCFIADEEMFEKNPAERYVFEHLLLVPSRMFIALQSQKNKAQVRTVLTCLLTAFHM